MTTIAHRTRGTSRLADILQTVRRRWRLRHMLAGGAVVVAITLASLWASSVILERAGFNAGSITVARWTVALIVLVTAVWFVVLPWLRRVSDEQVALYVEERVKSLDGALVSAVEVSRVAAPDEVRSPALAASLMHDAAERLHKGGQAIGIEREGLRRNAFLFSGAVALTAAVFALGPAWLREGARLVLTPWKDPVAAAPWTIGVEPGNTTVPRGSDQQVSATLRGFQSQLVEVLIRRGSADTWERIPMGSTGDSVRFVARLFDVAQNAQYFVEANGVRSPVYTLSVRDLPAVDRIDLELRYPAYTGMPAEKVEDTGDIAALTGTRALVKVKTTRPVRGGRLVIDGDSARVLALAPDGTLSGDLVVKRDGFYRVELVAEDGTRVAGAIDYVIDALDDAAPTVRIRKPGRDTRPTAVEEVTVEVDASDDFGLARAELVYRVNGGEEKTISLLDGARRPRDLVAAHTFFLEELSLEAGDVVSYYARVSDLNPVAGAKTSATDIYFLTIRRFDKDYKQNQAGGGGGGGGQQGTDPSQLTARQREVVSATFKAERDRASTPPATFRENVTTILLSEGKLREQVEKLAQQVRRPQVMSSDTGYRIIAELLPQAAKEMKAAEEQLGTQKTKDALPPEERALRLLERVEAVFRETQVSRGGGGGGGGGGQERSAEELADLFELENDKLRNQYEQVQRGDQPQEGNTAKLDETLERLKQLAARQQQENERLRQRMQQQGGGSGGGGSQRELADQAEEMARQLERLARERNSEELAESARRLQEAATAMRRSAASNGTAGRATSAAALDRLERARRLLEEGRSQGLAQGAQDATQRAEELVKQQREVASDVAGLGRAGAGRPDAERRLDQKKEEMVGKVDQLEEELNQLARDVRREQPDAARKLQEAAGAIREQRVADKIRYSRGVMRSGSPEYARNFENQITEDLEGVRDRIGRAAGGVGADSARRVAQALDKARDLVRGLSSLDERMRERARQQQGGAAGQQGQEGQGRQGQQGQGQQGQGQQGQGQQGQGQQGQGQQGQGQQGQQGQGQGRGQGQGQQGGGQGGGQQPGEIGAPGRAQGGPGAGGPGIARPGGYSAEDIRQFSRELRGQRQEAEDLRRELAQSGRSTQDIDRLIQRLRAIESERAFSDPESMDRLRSGVLDGFKEFEFALRRELGDRTADGPTLGGSNDVPAGYRDLVNEYFKALAKRPK